MDLPTSILSGPRVVIRKPRWRPVLSCLALLFTVLFADPSEAQTVTLGSLADYNFGSWANAGNLSQTNNTCGTAILSNGRASNYQTTLTDELTAATGSFYLYLDGDTASSSIEITIEQQDLFSDDWEFLTESTADNSQDSPDSNCPSGNNYYLRVNIASSEMSGKPGGDYEGFFRATITKGSKTASRDFYVYLTVAASPEVQISHLNSINFGQHQGVGDISVTETFCVYSSASGGTYRISVDSTGESGGNHYLVATSGPDKIPMTIRFADNGTGPGTVTLNANSTTGNGHTSSTDCAGTDNAALTFSLDESDLQAASTGTYSEQITILIVPE